MSDLLSQDEMTALRQGMVSGSIDITPPPEPGEVRPYVLGSEDHVGRVHVSAMNIICERFARSWRVGLFNLLRRSVDVKFHGVETVRFDEYTNSLDVPTHLTMMAVKPLRGVGLVMCQPALIYQIVDQFYGGIGKHAIRVENREFTKAEQAVINRMMTQTFKDLAEAWQPAKQVEMEVLHQEVNPRFAKVLNAREHIVVCRFSVNLDNGMDRPDSGRHEQASSGEFHIAYPFAMIDAIRGELESGTSRVYADTDDGKWSNRLREQLLDAELELSAVFAQRRITLGEILKLRVGDVLPMTLQNPFTLDAESVPLFAGKFATQNNAQAIQVDAVIKRGRNSTTDNESPTA